MAKREIDRFAVKPSGLFTRWRYKRVMIDENGILSTEPVPGESETMNLPCISDYRKTDRRYQNGALITEFCNLSTHTNYRVYAAGCEPFATVQTDLNAAKCGYEVPLPAPAIPPSPFDNGTPGSSVPTYGVYATLDICDHKNIPINIKIYKRNYVGAPIQIKNGGANPAILSYQNNNDYKLSPIRACEFQLTLVSSPTFNIEQLYTQDEREYKLEVKKDNIFKFLGFGTPEEAAEEFKGGPYDVTWRATDGLEALKKIVYPLPLGTRVDIQQKFIDILTYCLARTDLNLDIATIVNLYEVKMSNGLEDDPLAQSTINPMRFSDKGVIFDCYKVLEYVALEFGAFLVQDNGQWNFTRQNELTNTVLRRRIYNSTGLLLYGEQFNNRRTATCKGPDITMLDDKPMLRIGNAYKRAEVSVEHAEVPLILYNGDFEIWDGFNFTGWTKFGGIEVSRVENRLTTATGFVFTGNFSLQFDKPADPGKYIEAGRVLVNEGEVISLSFDVGNTTSVNNINAFKMRIKLNQYYLTNPAGDNNYIWSLTLATVTLPVSNVNGSIDTYGVELELPAALNSGEMTIQLYGFSQKVPGQYYPTQIDNIAISKSGKSANNKRSLYLAEQPAFYTTKPDEVKLLFGDYAGLNNIARPMRGEVVMGIPNDFYAIRTKDGSYSTGWYEYGGSSASALPIGLILAKNILKAYQKPFRFLESSFLGDDISYLDIINVNLPDDATFSARLFALQSGEFNLTTGELNNAVYAEIFAKDIPIVKWEIPGKLSSLFPPILQNPNPPVPPVGGIFTKEFRPQFK